ncbi:peptidylprolyl isomerase [Nocardioides sp. cx-169]|uniref:peptidylprolyl isomerase n=1 Tax=Nocardioides sp. cx-169 TaxID=2899080 RepID=UPI001E655826|nr:peptidylprolyl isomerase [Nocardioides sp. cx-169]MCD4535369.1 peptidylprolyl isomerase [Nocardioides sp. cx-169]
MLTRPLAALAAAVLMAGLAGCGDDTGNENASDSPTQPTNADGTPCTYEPAPGASSSVDLPADEAAYDGEVETTIVTSAGDLHVTLDAKRAPCTVNSFTSLAAQGYYDGTSCHRLTVGDAVAVEVLQCGDPTGTGSGGPGYSFADELSGDEEYPPGTMAMANAGADTNGSQFFFVHGRWAIPSDYTVFGQVDEDDLDILTDIAEKGVAGGAPEGQPVVPVVIEDITVE